MLEILIPIIIFAVLWGIGKLAGEDDDTGNMPSRPPGQGEDRQGMDERTRRIQEEIRRRIAERQGQHGQTPPPAPEQPREMTEAMRRAYNMPAERPPQQRQHPPQHPKPRPQHEHHDRQYRGAHYEPAAETDPLAEYRRKIEEQMRRAEEAREKAERIRREKPAISSAYNQRKETSWGIATADVSQLRQEIQDTLIDPLAARKAFLYMEIMGTPVGLRKQGHIRPPWEI